MRQSQFISRVLICFACLTSVKQSFCQVSINNSGTAPSINSILDINAPDKGLLIPRVNLVDTSQPISGIKPEGLLVWNENNSFDKGKGFYFWTGNKWHPILMIYKAGYGISIDSASNTITATSVVLNSLNADGIVPAPTTTNRYAEYKTDFKGNPAWRKPKKTMYYIDEF